MIGKVRVATGGEDLCPYERIAGQIRALANPTYGVPVLQGVYHKPQAIREALRRSAEGYWKGSFPGKVKDP